MTEICKENLLLHIKWNNINIITAWDIPKKPRSNK